MPIVWVQKWSKNGSKKGQKRGQKRPFLITFWTPFLPVLAKHRSGLMPNDWGFWDFGDLGSIKKGVTF